MKCVRENNDLMDNNYCVNFAKNRVYTDIIMRFEKR